MKRELKGRNYLVNKHQMKKGGGCFHKLMALLCMFNTLQLDRTEGVKN